MRRPDVSLICEGRCNDGAVQEFDAAVRAAGRTVVGTGAGGDETRTTLLDPRWLEDARAFVYTSHQHAGIDYAGHGELTVAKHVFACVECGTKRVFGFA